MLRIRMPVCDWEEPAGLIILFSPFMFIRYIASTLSETMDVGVGAGGNEHFCIHPNLDTRKECMDHEL